MESKTVLVVDDEGDIRECLREVLMDEGYSVAVASNGREALDLLPDLPRPCAVVLDLSMPVMNGTECYSEMRAREELADIPVLVSTSEVAGVPSGVSVARKPIRVDRFLAKLDELFRRLEWGHGGPAAAPA